MKYYLIVGEASGDLHASRLMMALKAVDGQAQFRFLGGDRMLETGGELVRHYRELAYMGFVPVLLHLPSILHNLKRCKADILAWQPDAVILVDYPGFNLKIAKFVRARTAIPVFYYISPKIWAWKEYRIRNIRRDVDQLFSILPFEVDFYAKHHYPVHYVGNPTLDEVASFTEEYAESFSVFCRRNLLSERPVIALVAGSRKQEIKDNLPDMIRAASAFPDYQPVLAGAPGIPSGYYQQFINSTGVRLISGQTYPLLSHARAALVTSGTATLETALFGVPQAVCYHTPLGKLIAFLKKRILKVPYISLVNLIAGREVVQELVADRMTVAILQSELQRLLEDDSYRSAMLSGYREVRDRLGEPGAPDVAARLLLRSLPDTCRRD